MVRNGVADRFLACGVLDHGFARIRSDDGTPPKRLRADCLHRRRLLGGIARVAPRTVTAARHRPRAPTRADRGQSPLGEGPTVALLQQIFEVDPLACPCCYGAMGIVAFITQMSVIDQILPHLGGGIPPSTRARPSRDTSCAAHPSTKGTPPPVRRRWQGRRSRSTLDGESTHLD